ncbi:N-acetylmuramoyl-L-alanine amidase [Metabacillus fastidiosus]|uniref:N-acetylmuramoyl-L-alanine amidase n=1 Tax=Metabacillus fastidiosus TaxID=1458 RepID=UPI002DBE8DE3|nr:N-acetylmuramoyl-L-alanine amidase [Metabacillus fastidiosus]MEC2077871.1 N-acetylmuramoyl-L-alanine amidase [Metabacillus fastidiosus]
MKQVRFLLFFTFVFLALVTPAKGFAQTTDSFPYIGEIKENQTKIHKGATTDYDVRFTLKTGDIVGVVGEFKNNLDEEWLNVSVSGVKGWVKKTSVAIKEDLPPSLYVKKDNTDVRKGANESYTSVEKLAAGQKVTVIDSYISKDGDVWYRIDLGIKQGWVSLEALTINSTNSDQTEEDNQVIQETEKIEVGQTVYIKNANTQIRRGALDSYRAVYTAKENESFKVIDEFVNNKNERWLRLHVSNSLQGWVIETAVQAEPSRDAQVLPDYIFVKSKDAVARRGALSDYRVVDSLPTNEHLKVIESFINKNNELWYRVELSSTLAGWVSADDISRDPKVDMTYYLGEYGNVRTEAQNFADAITPLSKGSAVYVVDHLINDANELWFQVKIEDGQLGWINSKFITSEIPYINQAFKAAGTVYVHKGATTDYTKIATLKKGTSVKIIYEFINNRNEHWYNVELSNKAKGWVLKEELTKGQTSNVPGVPSNPSAGALSGKKIVVDAGHGGKDPGATGASKLREKDVVLDVALKLRDKLEAEGATVLLTRSTDVFIELPDRVKISNNSKYDAFVSIHINSATNRSARGTETYYNTSKNGAKSKLLAESIQPELVKALNTYNRGVKTQNFAVIKNNELPSVLVELAFVSNPTEEAMLRDDAVRAKSADALTKGFITYFNGGK